MTSRSYNFAFNFHTGLRQKTQRKPPPKLTKRQLWNIESVSSSSGSGSSNGSCPIPYYTGRKRAPSTPSRTPKQGNSMTCQTYHSHVPRQPHVGKDEVGQARAMILMVLEELVNTENSYVHTLTQFLILRDEIFSPTWRIDRQKFM